MKSKRTNRGSVIVMVVGLLAMIAMLGVAFLAVTWMDRLQMRAMAARSQVDPTMQGYAAGLAAAMGTALPVGPGGPYAGSPAGPAGWLQFVDYYNPSDANSWLDANFYGVVGQPLSQVDTDGDGNVDAGLYRAAVSNSLGQQYYVAQRIIDASGLLNLNTAGSPDPNLWPPLPMPAHTPGTVNLAGALGAYYDALHKARFVNGAACNYSLRVYDAAAGRCLLQPDANLVAPFAIGEEMYLRWLKSPAPTEAGRLFPLLPPAFFTAAYRNLLTTYSASRICLRRPMTAATGGVWPYDDFTLRVVPDVSDFAARGPKTQATYKRVFAMLGKLNLGDPAARKKMAAAFVANLAAYQANGEAGTPWAFKPTDATGADENFTAYGLAQRLVITEAYAAHKTGTVVADDWIWGCAIELTNYTAAAINLAEYKLAGVTGVGALSGSVPANGGRVVIYNVEKGPSTAMANPDIGFSGSLNPSGPVTVADVVWAPVTNLSFLGSPTIQLVRTPGADVPADEVGAATDLEYDFAGPTAFTMDGQAFSKNIRRDDDANRCRYNVAAYARFDTPPCTHKLGQDNFAGSDATSLSQIDAVVKYPVPIVRSGVALADLAEFNRLYFAGPMLDGSNPRCFPKYMNKNTPTYGGSLGTIVNADARAHGRLDAVPTKQPYGYGGYSAGDYPDVPAGCLLNEFFTLVAPDPTRGTPATRVYGRINPNTAPPAVLARLPYPASIVHPATGLSIAVDPAMAADYIVAYRDRLATSDGKRNYADAAGRGALSGSNISGLRADAAAKDANCFLTPDEVAIPLADYANTLMGWTNYYSAEDMGLTTHRNYLDARDSIWRPISNLLTVNTDVAVSTVYMQLGDPATSIWHFVLVVDRGNCVQPGDLPAVILISEVR